MTNRKVPNDLVRVVTPQWDLMRPDTWHNPGRSHRACHFVSPLNLSGGEKTTFIRETGQKQVFKKYFNNKIPTEDNDISKETTSCIYIQKYQSEKQVRIAYKVQQHMLFLTVKHKRVMSRHSFYERSKFKIRLEI